MFDTAVPVSSSVIAFVTAVHAALLMIHLQRVRGARAVLVTGLGGTFAALAWVLTTPAWLSAGVTAHAGWTLICLRVGRARPTPVGAGDRSGRAAPVVSRAAKAPSFVPARVLAVIDETESIRTFRLARPVSFEFQPGQFLMVKVEARGETLARCYSISSAPEARGYLEISVKRQGRVSGILHDTVRPGDTLLVHPPLGRFIVPADTTEHLVLLAGGIGITPLMSILRHAVAAHPEQQVTLFYSVRERHDAAFRIEIDWLARRHPQFRAAMTVTAGDEFDGCRRGRIDDDFVRQTVPDPRSALYFICGPLPMIDSVRGILARLEVDAGRVRFEAFEAAAAVAASAAREPARGSTGRLQLTVSGRETDVLPSETLLDAAERAGAAVPSFCRAGICGTCRTRVVSGDVRCTGEALSEEDREHGYVLPCVSWALGDCALEA